MTIHISKNKLLLIITFALPALAYSQNRDRMMHPMAGPAMMCPALGEHFAPMMMAQNVDLKVTDIDNGIQVTWTSTDKENVAKLRAMGSHMQEVHQHRKSQIPSGKPQAPSK